MASFNNLVKTIGSFALVLVTIAIFLNSVSAMSVDKEAPEEASIRGGKVVSMPSGFARFFSFNARPQDHQYTGSFGYKRSSSALDALTGVTLGKRSPPAEYLSMEPFYNRFYGMRSAPRMYDIRWAPIDTYETPVGQEMN